jgi:hypothetical protein
MNNISSRSLSQDPVPLKCKKKEKREEREMRSKEVRVKRGMLWTGLILGRPFAESTPGQAHKGMNTVRVPDSQ